ncbi:hypothetical protein SprV_0100479300 [Sparganum proliferum]
MTVQTFMSSANMAMQQSNPLDAVINMDEEEDRAKNWALKYSARNHHLCRLLATETDSLRPTDQNVFDPLQKLASYPYAAELVRETLVWHAVEGLLEVYVDYMHHFFFINRSGPPFTIVK